MHILDKVIELFVSIPDDEWIANMVDDGFGNRCAMGHLMHAGYSREQLLEVEMYLIQFDRNSRNPIDVRTVFDPQTMMKINDNYGDKYTHFGITSKERIVNALKLARKLLKRSPVTES